MSYIRNWFNFESDVEPVASHLSQSSGHQTHADFVDIKWTATSYSKMQLMYTVIHPGDTWEEAAAPVVSSHYFPMTLHFPHIARCSFMQVHSRCCDTASCAGEAMIMPVINLYPPVKCTTYPSWITKEWGTHNKVNIMTWFCTCTWNKKMQELTCFLSLAHRTQSRWHQFSSLHSKKSRLSIRIRNVSSPEYAKMSWRKRNHTKHNGTISWLTVCQTVLQIAFCPSLDNSHLSNSSVSSFNFKDLFHLFWYFESGNDNWKRLIFLKNKVAEFQLNYMLTLHSQIQSSVYVRRDWPSVLLLMHMSAWIKDVQKYLMY